ncbi:cytochrome P450 [Actinokineospora xionganensis]|uniref:Cytochrome P450 n=1 Tax=Actinokineospora xionganensis TaxID=2684470 RepID=A0ABR7L0S4_9PSEU|nr:cytochrome P450 [Actinokineospora xionganensis]MBC6446001.1 cytochrome P450 [Actinokineospora xionganensis]
MTTAPRTDLTDVDLFVTEQHLDAFAWLRANDPIHWNEGADGSAFWALTRYDDVLWAYREHGLFGSTRGAVLGGSFRSTDDTAGNRMLVASDLPRHRLLKQVIHPALAATVVERVTAQVRVLLDAAIERMLADGGADIATDVATELPAGALMVVMGIDHAEAHHLIGLTRRMVGFRDEQFVDTGGDQRLRLAWLQAEVFEFFADLLAPRRARSGDDLLSVLSRAKLNGRPLPEEDIFFNCMNVAVGGNETSSYTACLGVEALLAHPEEHARLARTPDLLVSAVEEILRWASVNAYVQRVVKQDVERDGVLLRAGDSVTLWNVSANRDETRFDDPDNFDLGRTPNRHLSYGAGIHRCIGAPIAQTELLLFFERFAALSGRVRSSGPARRLRSNFILGTTSLPVAVG